MFKAGIIDPLKVVRTALQNAASIAGLMLTTETLVTDLDKEDKKKVGRGGRPLMACAKRLATGGWRLGSAASG